MWLAMAFTQGYNPRPYGAIAQLGERLHGMQEVSGSIPLGSTSLRRAAAETATAKRDSA